MAENRAFRKRQDGRHIDAVTREMCVPDGIDALVNHEQARAPHTHVNAGLGEAELEQLSPRNGAELPRGNLRNPEVDWAVFTVHMPV